MSDGVLDEREREMLDAFRARHGITEKEHHAHLRQLGWAAHDTPDDDADGGGGGGGDSNGAAGAAAAPGVLSWLWRGRPSSPGE